MYQTGIQQKAGFLMKEKFRRFMVGRYGMDGLGQFLNIAAIVLLVLGMFRLPLFYWLGLALVVVVYLRVFSRNTTKRIQENYAYYALRGRITGWFKTRREHFAQRRTYRFYRCPQCRQQLRVPRGRGRISITCPKCHTEFIKKS